MFEKVNPVLKATAHVIWLREILTLKFEYYIVSKALNIMINNL